MELFKFWTLYLGPVVQSIVSLTSLLVVKMLTVLVNTISNSQVFLLKNVSSFCKCKVAFANAKATHIFLAKILAYMSYLMIKVLTVLTNNIVSFEQLGPDYLGLLWNLRGLDIHSRFAAISLQGRQF